jgi:hypothetical protein
MAMHDLGRAYRPLRAALFKLAHYPEIGALGMIPPSMPIMPALLNLPAIDDNMRSRRAPC